jgi:D-glycero-D-manno-heptose 1,7-bisphosphate phosphatase
MLLEAARELDIDLRNSYMIGDGVTDIEAGQAAGTHTVFIGQSKPYIFAAFEKHGVQPDFVAPSLTEAVEIIKHHTWPTATQLPNL